MAVLKIGSTISEGRPLFLLFAMGLMMLLLNIDFTIINVALPSIATEFNMPLSGMQWAVNALLIGSATLLALGGRLGDIYGKRRLFFCGASLFIVASLCAGFSLNTWWLIISRLFQGVAIALCLPTIYAIPLTRLPKHQHSLAAGFLGMSVALGMLLGPTLGGIICELSSWRWIFWINVPVGLIALLLAKLAYPNDDHQCTQHFSDSAGAIILFIALCCLIFANTELQHWSNHGAIFFACLAGFIVFIVGFWMHEKNTATPLIDLGLFKIKPFKLISLIRTLFQCIFVSTLLFLALLIKNWLGYSSLQTGLILLAMTVSMATCSIITGKISSHMSAKSLLLTGAICTLTSCGLLFSLNNSSQLWPWLIALFVMGIASGLISSTCPKLIVASVPPQSVTVATGIFLSSTILGAAIGVSLSGSILALCSDYKLWQLLQPTTHHITNDQWLSLKLIANGARPLHTATAHQALLNQAIAYGFKSVIGFWTVLAVAMTAITCKYKG